MVPFLELASLFTDGIICGAATLFASLSTGFYSSFSALTGAIRVEFSTFGTSAVDKDKTNCCNV